MPTKPTGRPRGRPPGAKNIKPTIGIIADSVAGPRPEPPVVVETKKKYPNKAAAWLKKTPEERKQSQAALCAARPPDWGKNNGRKPGVPFRFTHKEWAALCEAQEPIINRIMKKMAQRGELPDDPRAVEAIKAAVTVLRTAADQKTTLSAADLLLRYLKAKPTAKVEVTTRTAEDYLDEIANEEDG